MRDLRLLAFTLLAMRQLGDNRARLVKDGRVSPDWYAGSQPLNEQAVRDLLNDGWLSPVEGNTGEVHIDAWPTFATVELRRAEILKTAASENAP